MPTGPWTEIGTADFTDVQPGYPPRFYLQIPAGAEQYLIVRPQDALGAPGADSVVLDFNNLPTPPTVNSVSPTAGQPGAQATFTADVTGSQPFTYYWNFAGGATPDTSTDASPVVTLGAEGDYSASVTVTNGYGQATFPFTLAISSGGNLPPNVVFTADYTSGHAPFEVAFDASGSSDPEGTNLTYEYDLDGDGTYGISVASPLMTHRYFQEGSYPATVRVTDQDGQWATNTTIITVTGWYNLWVIPWPTNSQDVAFDSSGNAFFVTGLFTTDCGVGVVKTAPDGSSIWQRSWRRTDGTMNEGASVHIATDSSGNAYVASDMMFDSGTTMDVVVLKYAPDGTVLWQRQWGTIDRHQYAHGIAVDASGNVFVAVSNDHSTGQSIVLLGLTTDGALTFEKEWNSPGYVFDSWGMGICVGADGNVYFTTGVGGGYAEMLVLKIGTGGNLIWQKLIGDPTPPQYLGGYGIDADANGNVYVVSQSSLFSADGSDGAVVKLDADGNFVFGRSWGGPYSEYFRTVDIAPDGNIIICGVTSSFSQTDPAQRLVITKMTYDGTFLIENYLNEFSGGAITLRGADVDADGRVAFTGAPSQLGGRGGLWQPVPATHTDWTTPSVTTPIIELADFVGGSLTTPAGTETTLDYPLNGTSGSGSSLFAMYVP